MAPELHLRRVPEEGASFDHLLAVPDVIDEQGTKLVVDPVRFRGELRRGSRGIELGGRMELEARPLCVRCLDAFRIPLRLSVRLTLVETAVDEEPGEVRIDELDARRFVAPEGRADLIAIAREQIWLGLPLKPLCRADCRGLCPTCGENRNRIECGCSGDAVDPRLAPLLRWKVGRRG